MVKRKGSKTYRRKNTYVRKVAKQEAKKAIATQVERKYYDSSAVYFGIDYTGTDAVYNLTYNPLTSTHITQGTDDVQYIGKKIRPIYLSIRGIITRGDTFNVMRCIIVQSKTNNVPTLAGILQSVTNSRAPLSAYERSYNDQWNIIYDKTFMLETSNYDARVFRIGIPMKRLRQISFRDNSGTLEKGGIYMCWISDSAATGHPTMTYYSRLTYTDA